MVLVAIFGLAVLKVAGLVIDGGYVFDYKPEADQAVLGAGQPSTFPAGKKPSAVDITGSVHEKPRRRNPRP